MADVLFAMRTRGARIWTEGGRLLYEAPRGALDRSDFETLRTRKSEIIEFLGRSDGAPRDPPLEPRHPSEPVPLTLTQSYFFNRIMAAGGRSRRVPTVLTRLTGPLDIQALEQALIELVRRHELLRCRIALREGVPRLETAEIRELPLQRIHLTGGSLAARETRAKIFVRQIVETPTDLATDPLFLPQLLVLGELDHILLIAMDHLIFDLPSLGILQKDLAALYAQAAHREPAALAAIPLQFADYAVWQQKVRPSRIDVHDAYWEKRLGGARHVCVFAEEGQYSPHPTIARFRFRFSQPLTAALRAFSLKSRTTLMMSVLAAYVAMLSRWCRTTDLVVPVPTIARRYPQLQNTIGPLGTVLYLRVEVREEDSFHDLLSRVVEEYNSAYEHDDSGKIFAHTPRLPFVSNPGFNFNSNLVFDWSGVRGPSHSPLQSAHFPVSLPFTEDLATALQEPQLFLVDLAEQLTGSFAYRSDRVRATTLKRFEQSFQLFAQTLVQDPAGRLPRLQAPDTPAPG